MKIKDNNTATNLEWCTSLYNLTYNNRHIKAGYKERGKISPYRKEVIVYSNGIEVRRADTPISLAKKMGLSDVTIRKHIYGFTDNVRGFVIRYADGSGKLDKEVLRDKKDILNKKRRENYANKKINRERGRA